MRRLRVILSNARGETFEGLTVNLSSTGMMVDTKHRWPAGHRLRAELCEGGQSAVVEGVIVRVVAGQKGEPYSVAVRFLRVPELLDGLVPGLDWSQIPPPARQPNRSATQPFSSGVDWGTSEPPPPSSGAAGHVVPRSYDIRITSKTALRKLYESELRYGGLFVAGPDRPSLDTLVFVDLAIAWLGTTPLRLTGRVVQTLDGPTGGFAIEIESSRSVLSSLEKMLQLS